MDRISRRSILLAPAGLAFADATPTAGQIIERIKQNVGVSSRAETVDRFVAGDADVPVKGIATTMMATLEVIQRAAAAGKNLVITHEPTFWVHEDKTADLEKDSTHRFKADFIRKNNMAVFRFHDHWHAHRPDGIATGMARELAWEKNADPQKSEDLHLFRDAFIEPREGDASQAQDPGNARSGRSQPYHQTRRRQLGICEPGLGIRLFARPDIDALIVGEAREWEVVEYAQDAISAGEMKALLVLGHVVSEQAGMKYCAGWLKTLIADVPVEFVAAAEPFWSPV